jgi:uncharacterized protein
LYICVNHIVMASKDTIISALKNKKPELLGLGVSSVGLFGSHVRNVPSHKSDIDILIDFEPGMETFDNYMAVYDLLEQLFRDAKVDVVTKKGLSPYIGPKILEQVEYV